MIPKKTFFTTPQFQIANNGPKKNRLSLYRAFCKQMELVCPRLAQLVVMAQTKKNFSKAFLQVKQKKVHKEECLAFRLQNTRDSDLFHFVYFKFYFIFFQL